MTLMHAQIVIYHVENVIIIFNHDVNACTDCYLYNGLFLCSQE